MALPRGVTAPATSLVEARRWMRVDGGESGGEIYRSKGTDPLYLKYGSGRVAGDIADEALRLQWLARRLPCPTVRAFTMTADAAWLVTTAVAGRTGDAWLGAEPEAWPAVVRGAAAFLQRLHALPVDDCPFEAGAAIRLSAAARNVAEGLVDETDFDDDHAGMSAAAVLAETRALLPIAAERVVTHGDFSLGNILFDAAGAVMGCIDVGRLGIADRYQDIAVLWQNLGEFGAGAQDALLDALGVAPPDQQRLTFHRCLHELC